MSDLPIYDLVIGERGRPIVASNEDELHSILKVFFGMSFPRTAVCAGHVSPMEALSRAYFAKDPFAVWFASRGFGGKSTLLAALTLVELIAGMDVVVLGGSAQQSARVLEAMSKGWNHTQAIVLDGKEVEVRAPKWTLDKEPNQLETKMIWGNWARALAASETSVRGPHPQRLRFDEVDVMDRSLFDSAMGQPLDGRGFVAQTVASSTRQNLGGTMDQIIEFAETAGFPVLSWCYRENLVSNGGWITDDAVRVKKATLTARMWQIEIENQEPAGKSKALNPDALQKLVNGDEIVDEVGEELVFEEPVSGADYVTSADWAREMDHTVITTLRYDVSPAKVVAFYRDQKQEWPVMIQNFNDRLEQYPGKAIHDATGVGSVITHLINVDDEAVDFVFSTQSKKKLFTNYITMVEQGKIQSPKIRSLVREHKTATTDIMTGKEHAGDTWVAMSLAAGMLSGLDLPTRKQKKNRGRILKTRRF